jgi:uncharacterized protein involved in exopolysaccharide biosynthesis
MFILSIIIGTVVTSALVALKKDTYEAVMVIGLAGDATIAETLMQNKTEGSDRNPVTSSAARKASRLKGLWLADDPKFLDDAMRDIGLDRRYGADYPEILKKIKTSIVVGSELLNGQYLRVSMTWNKEQEAQDILKAVYSRFSSRTVDTETAVTTTRRTLIEKEFAEQDKIANEFARKRIAYLRENWNDNPTYLGQAVGRVDTLKSQIDDLTADQAEAATRLQIIQRELARVPEHIVGEDTVTTTTTDPNAQLRLDEEEYKKQLAQARSRYLDTHPTVIEIQKKLDQVRLQIKENESKPVQSRPTATTQTRTRNPLWVQLKQLESNYLMANKAFDRKLAKLIQNREREQKALEVMPSKQAAFVKMEHDYQLYDNIRNRLRVQLETARMDERRDKETNLQSVSLAVEPRAEKLVTAGKGMLLYGLGPILGIIIAFGFSLLAEALDHTLRSPVDVEKHLGKPVLAVIPKMKNNKAAKALTGGSQGTISS